MPNTLSLRLKRPCSIKVNIAADVIGLVTLAIRRSVPDRDGFPARKQRPPDWLLGVAEALGVDEPIVSRDGNRYAGGALGAQEIGNALINSRPFGGADPSGEFSFD